MLLTRVLAALCFTPPIVLCAWIGGPLLQAALFALGLLMLWEFIHLQLSQAPWQIRGLTYVLGGLNGAWALQLLPPPPTQLGGSLLMLLALLTVLWRPVPPALSLQRGGLMLLGVLYCTSSLSFLHHLRSWPEDGRLLVLLALLCTWASDTGAYFTGRAFGRTKLYPAISPGKTWEGALGGLLVAMFAGWALQQVLGTGRVAPQHAVLIGAVAALSGLLGDLCESLLKRSVGAKDSSRLIPGHGGVLDRFDGVLFSAPVLYALVLQLPDLS